MRYHDRRNFLKITALLGAGLGLDGYSRGNSVPPGSAPAAQSIFKNIHQRRSVRAFRPDPVPDEHVERILDAARMAPSSGNQQPWKFMVIRNTERLATLKEESLEHALNSYKETGMLSREFEKRKKELESHYEDIFKAPVFIVILVDTQSKYPEYNKHDGPLAAANLMLAARALGYGTCYFTHTINEEITMSVLKIPDRYRRICITPLGVPKVWSETPPKKVLKDFIIEEKF